MTSKPKPKKRRESEFKLKVTGSGVTLRKCNVCRKRYNVRHTCFRGSMGRSPEEVDGWRTFSAIRGMGEVVPGAMPGDYQFYLSEQKRGKK
jgi:hypothetical protein